mgnify:CR=1 FL=1
MILGKIAVYPITECADQAITGILLTETADQTRDIVELANAGTLGLIAAFQIITLALQELTEILIVGRALFQPIHVLADMDTTGPRD